MGQASVVFESYPCKALKKHFALKRHLDTNNGFWERAGIAPNAEPIGTEPHLDDLGYSDTYIG